MNELTPLRMTFRAAARWVLAVAASFAGRAERDAAGPWHRSALAARTRHHGHRRLWRSPGRAQSAESLRRGRARCTGHCLRRADRGPPRPHQVAQVPAPDGNAGRLSRRRPFSCCRTVGARPTRRVPPAGRRAGVLEHRDDRHRETKPHACECQCAGQPDPGGHLFSAAPPGMKDTVARAGRVPADHLRRRDRTGHSQQVPVQHLPHAIGAITRMSYGELVSNDHARHLITQVADDDPGRPRRARGWRWPPTAPRTSRRP